MIPDFLRKVIQPFRANDTPQVTVLTDVSQLESVWQDDLAVVYKHSPICTLSAGAMFQVNRFIDTDPEVPVYVVDVLRNRDVSDEIEQHLGLRHESPQLIIVKGGEPVWNRSHVGITKVAIAAQVEAARSG